jgi:hypothetical protein
VTELTSLSPLSLLFLLPFSIYAGIRDKRPYVTFSEGEQFAKLMLQISMVKYHKQEIRKVRNFKTTKFRKILHAKTFKITIFRKQISSVFKFRLEIRKKI